MPERNVTRAATRIRRSQPAVSNALLRLRQTFGDPLFVRGRLGVSPTQRALQLAVPITDALSRLRDGLRAPEAFDPTTAKKTFVLAASDHAQLLVVPALAKRLARWPGLKFRVVPLPGEFPQRELERGEFDLVLGVFDVAPGDRAPTGLKRQVLVDEKMVAIARRGHPGLKRSLAAAIALPQINVSPRGGTTGRYERARGRPTRNIVFYVPHYLVMPWVLESTELIAVMPERVATLFAASFALEIKRFEMPTPRLKVQQLWHPGAHGQPANQWLRAQVFAAAKER